MICPFSFSTSTFWSVRGAYSPHVSGAQESLERLKQASWHNIISKVSDWGTVDELSASATQKDARCAGPMIHHETSYEHICIGTSWNQ